MVRWILMVACLALPRASHATLTFQGIGHLVGPQLNSGALGDVIVGTGINPDGNREDWVIQGYLSQIPERSVVALLFPGWILLARRRRA